MRDKRAGPYQAGDGGSRGGADSLEEAAGGAAAAAADFLVPVRVKPGEGVVDFESGADRPPARVHDAALLERVCREQPVRLQQLPSERKLEIAPAELIAIFRLQVVEPQGLDDFALKGFNGRGAVDVHMKLAPIFG